MHTRLYATLLLLLGAVTVVGLLSSTIETPTGFAVVEPEPPKEPKLSCVGNIPHDTCSKTKPLFCNDGEWQYNCYECGCEEGMQCGDFGVCEPLRYCADGSLYGECSFLKGKQCVHGTLQHNCQLCGCEQDEFCSEDGRCLLKQNT